MNITILLFFLLQTLTLTLTTADTRTYHITSDSRPLIHFQTFGFSSNGTLSLSLSDATFSSSFHSPNPSLFAFVLIPSSNILQLLSNPNPNPNSSCILFSPHIRLLFTFSDLSPPPFNSFNRSFHISTPSSHSLFFATCDARDSQVSFTLQTSMFNSLPDGSRDFLPLGDSPVPLLCFLFALAYVTLLGFWIRNCLLKNRAFAHRIHYLMALLLAVKALNLLLRSEDEYCVKASGTHHGWDWLFYLFQAFKGVLLFSVIVLIGTGWSFLRPFLHEREKRVLKVVIPLQVVTNVAAVAVVEWGHFVEDPGFWIQVMVMVDLVCCCAVLFPVVWSIRMLREVEKMDGKARRNLAKLVMFRRFYVGVIGYLYFTRVVVFVLETVLSYEYKWVSVVVEEGVTLGFYGLMFYTFRPKEKNEYFALNEQEAAEAVKELKDGWFDV